MHQDEIPNPQSTVATLQRVGLKSDSILCSLLKEEEDSVQVNTQRGATKALTYGVSKLASDAMHAMNGRCAFLHISDPKQRCKLFASQVLPVLSYAREVCAVMKRSAEQLHRQFLKH